MAAQFIGRNDMTTYPWLHMVDNPFESWQSTLLFIMILILLLTIIIFLGKQYARAMGVKKCSCCCGHQQTSSGRSGGLIDQNHNPATTSSHDMFQPPSRIRWLPWSHYASPPNVTIGAVNQSALAKRRRGVSASNPLPGTVS